ncbi:phosphoribosyl pyrophosphate synthase-associated protein 1 isoform X3 [Rissa tridactyla]|uniref:phosphoribosyl pyrophosphate synthase-associated protein 1 isoform X3 n=1 Tax=Rissa tridactyla TaxID=75485 RepID=UPI0023BAB03F|nr:phosphoribosyl pyrophosphate synthase-associated protein 1 isoform X3 [Rissa tridactyla]
MPRKLLLPYKSVFSHFRAPRGLHDSLAMNAARSGYRVFSANSTAACTELAKRITERLGAELGKSVVYQETNGETRVEIKESVRGQDVFIIQTIPRDVNTAVMELLIMAYALKTSCARNIIGVIPYFPYSKQSKMRKRGSIVCKLLASMLAKAGLTHIITMDLHQKEIQGFFSFPVDNLRASPFLLQYIQEEIPDYRNAVIVAKSPDAAKRAQSYAERLRLGLAVIHGEAQCTEQDMDDGRHSPPMVKNATVHPGLELPCTLKVLTPSERALCVWWYERKQASCSASLKSFSSPCTGVCEDIWICLLSWSDDGQGETANNCGWRCWRKNCHHRG